VQSENKVLTRAKGSFISGALKGLSEYYSFSINRLQFTFIFIFFCGIGLSIKLVVKQLTGQVTNTATGLLFK
jgi:phage shock protein PspC (stress-responsive transcriptional regulator)